MNSNKIHQASLKSSSGEGFKFEDQVAAYLSCEMLLSKSIFHDSQLITKIERQAVDFDPFGDIVLYLTDTSGNESRALASVKSNKQITSNGVGSSIRDDLWKVYDSTGFNEDSDRLFLCSTPPPEKTKELLSQLCKRARGTTPKRLATAIKHQKNIRQIHDSLARDLASTSESGKLIKIFTFQGFDFASENSDSISKALDFCSSLLAPEDSSAHGRPEALWLALLTIAEEMRLNNHTYDVRDFIKLLRNQFQLKDYPNDQALYSELAKRSTHPMSIIRTNLSNGYKVERHDALDKLRDLLKVSSCVWVSGESGVGKSALVKTFLDNDQSIQTKFWFRAENFQSIDRDFTDLSGVLARSSKKGIIVIDSIESCYDISRKKRIGDFISELLKDNDDTWKVIICGQTRDIQASQRQLSLDSSISQNPLEVGHLNKVELDQVLKDNSSIKRVSAHTEFFKVLSRLKILDLLAQENSLSEQQFKCEADVINWWWSDNVNAGRPSSEEGKALRKIAVYMANQLVHRVNPEKLDIRSSEINKLIDKGVLIQDAKERIMFEHDLLADWSRVKHLSLCETTDELFEQFTTQPPWLRSIQIFSQQLIERPDAEISWETVIKNLTENKELDQLLPKDLLLIDTWLESIIYSHRSYQLLKNHYDLLLQSKGFLLYRLLNKSLNIATKPDLHHQKLALEQGINFTPLDAESVRLPNPTLMNPVLVFLCDLEETAIAIAPDFIAEVGILYSKFERYGYSFDWSRLAKLVLMNANKLMLDEVNDTRYVSDKWYSISRSKLEKIAYESALGTAQQDLQGLKKVLLKACGLNDWDKGDLQKNTNPKWQGIWVEHNFFGNAIKHESPDSWDKGPKRATISKFRQVWYEGANSLATFKADTDLAVAVSLAFAYDWPKRPADKDYHSPLTDRRGFTYEVASRDNSFWWDGPFIHYLRADWEKGLSLIIDLVDFATDRYTEWWPYTDSPVEIIEFQTAQGSVVKWKGNHQVYRWNRFSMNTAYIISSALSALEKFFYERIEEQKDVDTIIGVLFDQSRSLAFCGVLVSVGKCHPQLFSESLSPLLSKRAIYMFDQASSVESVGLGSFSFHEPEWIRKAVYEWENIESRRTPMLDVCCQFFIHHPDSREPFEKVSETWRNEARSLPKDEKIIMLRWACNYDISMWRYHKNDDGSVAYFQDRPEELNDQGEHQEHFITGQLMSIPHSVTQIIEKQEVLSPADIAEKIDLLKQWAPYETVSESRCKQSEDFQLFDHRHAKSAIIALVLCAGHNIVSSDKKLLGYLEKELCELINNPPPIYDFTPQDSSTNFRDFVSRSAIHMLVLSKQTDYWRRIVLSGISAYKYNTVKSLFQEAHRLQSFLGDDYTKMLFLSISFSVVRMNIQIASGGPLLAENRVEVDQWIEHWSPRFLKGDVPMSLSPWKNVEVFTDFKNQPKKGQKGRSHYSYDIALILSSFSTLLSSIEVKDQNLKSEVIKELVIAFFNTLPLLNEREPTKWSYNIYEQDRQIFKNVVEAAFNLESSAAKEVVEPFTTIPPAGYHYIKSFLGQVYLEALRRYPDGDPEGKFQHIWTYFANSFDTMLKESAPRGSCEIWEKLLFIDGLSSEPTDLEKVTVTQMAPYYQRFIDLYGRGSHSSTKIVRLLSTYAGQNIQAKALSWFESIWSDASSGYWDDEDLVRACESLIASIWENSLEDVKKSKSSFRAFSLMVSSIAATGSSAAIKVQSTLGRVVGNSEH